MKIGITGDGASFIGSWLYAELERAGHDPAYLSWDVRGSEEWSRILPLVRTLDVIYHVAARVGRVNCEAQRMDVIATNVGGTMNVARACAEAGVRMIYVSSSEAPYGRNLYGLTKRWGEEVAQLYCPDLRIQRLYMPYGPGHPPGVGRAALTNFLWNARNRQPIDVHQGTSRAWCWIGDTVSTMQRFMLRGEDVVEIGRDDNTTSMLTVAKLACEMTGANQDSLIRIVPTPADITPAKPIADPVVDATVELEDGMERVLYWLDNYYAEGKPWSPSST